MDHWPFIIAAYGLTIGTVLVLSVWSYATMRSQERQAADLREARDK
jgi:heme exporter protein CcmD